MVVSLPKILAHAIVTASHWVGFTLPGIIDEPGSFDGMMISLIPHRGPDASNLMSLAILNKLMAVVFNADEVFTTASCTANDSNLLSET